VHLVKLIGPDLIIIAVIVWLIITGRRPRPPRIHPIPGNDSFFLNRLRAGEPEAGRDII